MNWEAISAVGEIVGATAVVVTLIYLAVQIRHGTKATQAANIQAAAAMDQEALLVLGADPATAQMWATFLTVPETLPDDQKLQGVFSMAAVVRRLEANLIQNRLGTLSKEGWESRQPLFIGIARSPGYSVFSDSPVASFLTDEIRNYMAEIRAGEGPVE